MSQNEKQLKVYAAKIDGMDHDKFWQRRYEFCMPIFAKTMRRLWW